jgi:hypothetical protein
VVAAVKRSVGKKFVLFLCLALFFALDLLFCWFLELIVSHDCDILYDDTASHFHLFVFVCRIEMSIIPSLQTKIDFITDVVILSFGVPAPFTLTPNADVERSRNDWIRAQIDEVFPDLSEPLKTKLMLLSNTIHTLAEAKEILAEAKAERQFLFQQGDFIFFHFLLFSSHFFKI